MFGPQMWLGFSNHGQTPGASTVCPRCEGQGAGVGHGTPLDPDLPWQRCPTQAAASCPHGHCTQTEILTCTALGPESWGQ